MGWEPVCSTTTQRLVLRTNKQENEANERVRVHPRHRIVASALHESARACAREREGFITRRVVAFAPTYATCRCLWSSSRLGGRPRRLSTNTGRTRWPAGRDDAPGRGARALPRPSD